MADELKLNSLNRLVQTRLSRVQIMWAHDYITGTTNQNRDINDKIKHDSIKESR